MTEAAQTEPDELRGTGISGGETRHVAKGDIFVIPTGIPHWLSTIDNGEIIYLVVKPRQSKLMQTIVLMIGFNQATRLPQSLDLNEAKVKTEGARGGRSSHCCG